MFWINSEKNQMQNWEWLCFMEKRVMYSLDKSENCDFWRYWKGTFSIFETAESRAHLFSLPLPVLHFIQTYPWGRPSLFVLRVLLVVTDIDVIGLGGKAAVMWTVCPFRSPLELTKGGFFWSFLRFAIQSASLNSSMGNPFLPFKALWRGVGENLCPVSWVPRSLLHSEPLCRPWTTDSGHPRPCWLFHLLGLPLLSPKSCNYPGLQLSVGTVANFL